MVEECRAKRGWDIGPTRRRHTLALVFPPMGRVVWLGQQVIEPRSSRGEVESLGWEKETAQMQVIPFSLFLFYISYFVFKFKFQIQTNVNFEYTSAKTPTGMQIYNFIYLLVF
jgi:hypothetical protein